MRRFLSTFLLSLMVGMCVVAQTAYQDYHDGQIYLKYKQGANKQNRNITNYKDIPIDKMYGIEKFAAKYGIYKVTKPFYIADDDANLQRIYKVYFTNSTMVDEMMRELNALNYIEYAEKVPIMKTFLTPNDPSYSSQWFLTTINAPAAWGVFSGTTNITVAIVDNAIQITHPDIAANKWINPGEIPGNGIDDDGNGFIDDINGWDVADDDNNPNPPNSSFNHGTHCAGDASGVTNNGTGIASIGWGLRIIAVKATPDAGNSGSIYAGYDGILYAARVKAKVISCSWGGTGSAASEQSVINYAWGRGCIVVCAAGNDNNSTLHYPAAYNNVFCVASTGSTDVRSSFSCYGTWVDISSPGENIYSTIPNNTYGNMSGTSMATPITAGLCGLILAKNPYMSPQAVLNCITSTAANIYTVSGNASYSGKLGAGRIDAYAALLCAQSSTANPPVANFTSNRQVVCPGQTINFYDNSYFNPTSWSWTFQGGTPATSTSSVPVVSWSTPGTYSVSLTATNANGSNTLTKLAYVTVSSVTTLPLSEGFQGTAFPPAGWTLDDKFQDSVIWYRRTSVGGFGASTACTYFDNYDMNARGLRDGLWTPKYNFTAVSAAWLKFDVAYARYDATYSDSLEVLITTNCGNTWTSIYLKGGTTLATAPDYTAAMFSPTVAQWRKDSINITSYAAGQGNVMIAFANRGHYGQALYLDNINITYTASIAPTANFNYSASGCVGVAMTFTDISTNSPTSWNWQMPGGTPSVSAVQNPTVTYNTPGVYSVTMTATNAGGNSTVVKSVTINPTPTVTVNSATICSGSSATLSASGAATFSWNTGATTSSITITPTSTAVYTVTGTSSLSCSSAKTTTVTVNANPTVTVNSATICSGSSATLSASGATTFSWNTGATTSSINVTPTSTAVYTVTGTSSLSCSSSKTTTVTVNANPTVTVNSATICSGSSATLSASGAATFSWNTGATTSSINVTPTSTAVYTVTGTSSLSCSSSKTTTVTVKANPTASANVTNASCNGLCNGSVTISASGGLAPYTYSYTSGSNTSVCAGTYSATITDGNNCSAVIPFTINQPPAILANTTHTDATCSSCVNGVALANPTGGVGPYTYTWTPGGLHTSAISGLLPGCYSVTIVDANNCSVTDTTCISYPTGIVNITNQYQLKIYPNPNNGKFTIEADKNYSVKVYNSIGQLIRETDVMRGANYIDMNEFGQGIYNLVLFSDSKYLTFRLVIEQ